MSQIGLPVGWVLANYADVYLSASNGTGGSQNKEGVGIPVSRIETIANETIDYSRIGYLAEYEESKVEKHKLNFGDILFSHINSPIHLGKTAIYDGLQPLYHGINLLRIVVDREVVLPEFFDAHCRYIRALGLFSLNAQHAVNQSSLNQKKLGSFELPLPPLAEQQIIIDKLDSLLAQVESIKTRLERIPEILKQFRQSVLAAAVSGKLTEEWRGNSDSRIIEEYSKWDWGSGVPINWDVDIYPHLVKSRLGKMLDKQKNEGKPTKYLGNINVRWASFDLENIQEILVSEKEQIELAVQVGDVLICEGGEPGRCAIWKSDYNEPIIFQKALHRARVSDRLLPEWLVFNLKNDADRNTLDQLFTGTTIKHLTGAALKSYPLRVPPINEQKEILNRVNSLFFKADVFEDQVKSALDRVNNLAQSILAKAFRGELTTEWREANPELISGENSAEALLKRIKAERELAKPATRRGRGKA